MPQEIYFLLRRATMRKQIIAQDFECKITFHRSTEFFVDIGVRRKHYIGNNLFNRAFLG